MTTIFVDANVPMYLVGSPHPNRDRAWELLREIQTSKGTFITDAEVLQELLHRYIAIGRRETLDEAIRLTMHLCLTILSITSEDVLRAREVLREADSVNARDAIHVAVMRRYGITRILSFGRHFDAFADLERIA